MYIATPNWITHANDKKRKSTIFSLHVDPTGQRVATGGQDCAIKIWNLRPIVNKAVERDASVPKLLCSCIIHTGAVLCVRWSNHNGTLLASGSDDKSVIIWIKQEGSSNNFLSGERNVETWKAYRTLQGHKSDVCDIAWSPDNSYLASASFDSSVIIWSTNTFEKLHVITGHDGFVKGLCWDPVGKFLATQSDDKSLKVWRTSDWECETTVSKPYDAAPSTTYFRRLSWSPEGSCIVSVNGENGTMPTAPIVNRNGWLSEVSLYGHQAPIECASFNPKLFKTNDPAKSLSALVAIGSQDCGISFWWTAHPRSVVVTGNLFSHSVLDMCWTPEGYNLLACSFDGTVRLFHFTKEDLGETVSDVELEHSLAKLGYKKERVTIPETTMQVDPPAISRPLKTSIQTNSQPVQYVQSSSFPTENVAAIQKQTITKDGKKRITPVFVGSQNANLDGVPAQSQFFSVNSNSRIEASVNGKMRNDDNLASQYVLPTIVVAGDAPSLTLSLPETQKKTKFTFAKKKAGESYPVEIEVRNEVAKSKIVVTHDAEVLWKESIPVNVLSCAVGNKFYAFATANSQIWVYSNMGRKMIPSILVDSPISFMDASGEYLMTITTKGYLNVWNMEKTKILIKSVNVLPALRPKSANMNQLVAISSGMVSADGIPKLRLSNGTTVIYDIDLECWMIIEEFSAGSSQSVPSILSENVRYTIPQLEGQLASAQKQNNYKEYLRIFRLYVKKLCDEEMALKLTEILDELILDQNSTFYEKLDEKSGVTKQHLLKETLSSMSLKLSLQRIVNAYSS